MIESMIESKSLLTVGEKAPHYAEILKKTWHATSHNSAGYWMAEGLLQYMFGDRYEHFSTRS